MTALAGAMLISACAPSKVESISYTIQPSPRPDRVLVSDFTVSAQDVKLDQAVGLRLLRVVEGKPLNQQEWRVALTAQTAVTTAPVGSCANTGCRRNQATERWGAARP